MLSPTGDPEQGFPITSYLAGSAGHGKTDTAEFLTCVLFINVINSLFFIYHLKLTGRRSPVAGRRTPVTFHDAWLEVLY